MKYSVNIEALHGSDLVEVGWVEAETYDVAVEKLGLDTEACGASRIPYADGKTGDDCGRVVVLQAGAAGGRNQQLTSLDQLLQAVRDTDLAEAGHDREVVFSGPAGQFSTDNFQSDANQIAAEKGGDED